MLFARLQLSLWSNFKFLLRIFRISSRNLHSEIVVSIQYFVLFLGTYESAGCPVRECTQCNKSCPEEEYITADCSLTRNTQCAKSSPPCQSDEFEYKPCTNYTNRQCMKLSSLPAPTASRWVTQGLHPV